MKVAIVDDSPLMQQRIGRMLADLDGIEIVGYADDVASAIRLIDATSPHLVVLDVDLRDGAKGIDVLRHVVRAHAQMQVVALSNFTWSALRETYLAEGARAYFDKALEFNQARDWIVAMQAPRGG